MEFPTIALLTDFGERDGFVGVMKGVMLSKLQTPVPMIDISHGIAPQNVRQGLWVLENAYRYFPAKTVFLAIVDPGVGSAEQACLLCYWPERQQAFMAPDNGLLTPIVEAAGNALQCYDIRRSQWYLQDTLSLHGRSQTFYGRDVYAPMAALMANAFLNQAVEAFLSQLGGPLKEIHHIMREPATQSDTNGTRKLQGDIVAADVFGNLITNIPHDWIAPDGLFSVSVENRTPFLCPFALSYSSGLSAMGSAGPVIMVPSSSGMVELSIFQGNAQQFLQAQPGERILIQAVP
jgi:S-adenosylmethionine hydrolase